MEEKELLEIEASEKEQVKGNREEMLLTRKIGARRPLLHQPTVLSFFSFV
jgi:hypothetical protein